MNVKDSMLFRWTLMMVTVILATCGLTVEGAACMGCGSFLSVDVGTLDAGTGEERALSVADAGVDAGRIPSSSDASVHPEAGDPFMPTAYGRAVLADRPLAYWPLDDSGPVAIDVVGGHDAHELIPVGWGSPGARSTTRAGITLAGGCLDAGPVAGLDGAFTVEMWVADAGSDRSLIRQGTGTVLAQPGFAGWGLRVTKQSPPEIAWEEGRYPSVGQAVTSALPAAYTHVVAAFDGTDVMIYFNGVFVLAQSGGTPTLVDPNPEHLTIGCDPRGPVTARLDEIAVYDHALSSTRAFAHFAASKQ